jgi:hypothetical protein
LKAGWEKREEVWKMNRKAVVSLVLVVLFLVSVFPIGTFSGVAVSHGSSGVSESQFTVEGAGSADGLVPDRTDGDAIAPHQATPIPRMSGAADPVGIGYTQPSGLVGYWKVDEGAGPTAYDSSGNNNNGIVYGASWTGGKVGNALSFDGVNEYVDCGTGSSLMPTAGITLEAWVKANDVSVYGTIVSTFYYEGYFLRINPNAGVEFAPGICYSPNGIIQAGVWHHVVGTFNGVLAQIYVDGTLVGSQGSGYLAYTGQPLRIGGNPGDNTLWFNGIIDEVKIYSRALSAAEVWAEYATQTVGPYCELLATTFTQNFNNMSYNVTAVQQDYNHTFGASPITGPAYFLVGLSNTGFYYMIGLSWDWGGTRAYSDGRMLPTGRYTPGFNAIYQVFGPSGIVYPTPPQFFSVSLPVNQGDSVQLALSFSGGSVLMSVHDWNTGAIYSTTCSAYLATTFVGLPNSLADSNGYFTGLMTQQYFDNPYYGDMQAVTYSDMTFAKSSAWTWVQEFDSSTVPVYLFNVSSLKVYSNPTQLQQFTSNGATEFSNAYQFVTGTLPRAGLAYTSKPQYVAGGNVVLGFNNTGSTTITLTSTAPWVILDALGTPVYQPIAAMMLVSVLPGQSMTWGWNQVNNAGQQVAPGTYIFQIQTLAGSFAATFRIVAGKTQLTADPSTQDMPSIIVVNNLVFQGYFLAYQSWETGTNGNGDVFVEKYDTNWNLLTRVQATNLNSYQDSPSLALVFDGSAYYLKLAYVSTETDGRYHVFVQTFDLNLNFVAKKQITSSVSEDLPSIIFDTSRSIYIAYQSWETGDTYQGDIFIEKLDLNLVSQLKVRVTTEPSYQDCPSLLYNHETGTVYIAYVSNETGNVDIFLKQYDSNLNYLGRKFQLTADPTIQYRPSLAPIYVSTYPYIQGFQMAYHSWETGTSNQRDIFVEDFDLSCNSLGKTQITNDQFYSATPSMVPSLVALGYSWCSSWVAYVSDEAGNWDIWLSPGTQPTYPVSQPLCAMKTTGWFYVPTYPTGPTRLRIEMLGGPNGDQTGGVSPYTAVTEWPSGQTSILDIAFVAHAFGSTPGSLRWNYMADCVPERIINILDISFVAKYFGLTGTYLMWPQSNVSVQFSDGTTQSPGTTGFVTIPPTAANFTIYQNGNPVSATVTFWP